MPLGFDPADRYAVVRPFYQYLITYVDRLGRVPLDSLAPSRGDSKGRGWAYMPYVPHTIAPYGRSCEGCHLNRMAAGLGMEEELTRDTRLTIPSPPAVKTMRNLNDREQKSLLAPSTEWQRKRLQALTDPPS